jgi:hypothetical protein
VPTAPQVAFLPLKITFVRIESQPSGLIDIVGDEVTTEPAFDGADAYQSISGIGEVKVSRQRVDGYIFRHPKRLVHHDPVIQKKVGSALSRIQRVLQDKCKRALMTGLFLH